MYSGTFIVCEAIIMMVPLLSVKIGEVLFEHNLNSIYMLILMFAWLGSYPLCAAEQEFHCSIEEVSKTLMSMDKQVDYVLEITDQCLCCESIVQPKTTMHAPKRTVRSGAPDKASYEMNFKFKE